MRLSDFLLAVIALALGLFGLGIAFAFLPQLREYLQLIASGHDWQFGELARYLGLVTGPSCLALLVLLGAATWIRFSNSTRSLATIHPGEPWLWRRDWAERRIRLSNRSALYATLAISGFYLSLVVPMCVAMAEVKNGGMIYSFLGLLTLILLGFFRILWTNRVWNRSELELKTLPGLVGGPFAGVVLIPELFAPDTAFRVTLRCHETSKRSSRGSIHTAILWQDQHVISKTIAAGRPGVTALPVQFSIPFDCEPTGTEILGSRTWIAPNSTVRGHISWSLSVVLKREGDTREAKFDVPVFKTAASSPDYQEAVTEIEPYLEPVDTEAVLARFPFSSRTLADGGRLLKFSLFKPDLALFLLGLSGGAAAALWALVTKVDTWPIIFILGMMPVALMVIGVTSLVEIVFWKSAIAIYSDRVEFTAGYIGRQTRIVWPRNEPIPLSTAEEFRKDNGAWWSVQVSGLDGEPLRVIKRLDGKQEAAAAQKWLAAQWGQAANTAKGRGAARNEK